MIFVNYGCGGYGIFDHAIWNGLHIADVIFPWLLWIMGVCIPISVSSAFKRGETKKCTVLNILRVSHQMLYLLSYITIFISHFTALDDIICARTISGCLTLFGHIQNFRSITTIWHLLFCCCFSMCRFPS